MILSWMVYLLFVGATLAISALALEKLFQRTSLPTRFVWFAALAGIVGFALLAPRKDDAGIGVPLPTAVEVTASGVTSAPTESIAGTMRRIQRETYAMLSNAFVFAEMQVPRSVARGISVAWGLSTVALLILFVSVSNQMDDERRRWPVARIAGARVRLAPSVGPAVVGLSEPEIVVPRWLLGRDIEEQRLVIVHESEHVAANDQLLMTVGWLVVVLLPWHPAAWWMMSRLRLAIELDCDARVLKHGVPARNYGSLLIDIAGQCAGHRLGALALADKTSHLERRLLAMKPIRTRFTAVRVAALGAVASVAVLAACEARLPTSAEITTMDVASAEQLAVKAKMINAKEGPSVYVVDGKEVSEMVAHGIMAEKIAHLEIAKTGGAASRILISTKENAGPEKANVVTGFMMKAKTNKDGTPVQPLTTGDVQVLKLAPANGTSAKDAPLFLIDGVVSSADALKALKPADIMGIEVLKNHASNTEALRTYNDPAALNGVVMIRTKNGHASSSTSGKADTERMVTKVKLAEARP